MDKHPEIDDKSFFDTLDELQLIQRESHEGYPWDGCQEDRGAAEECVASLYEARKIPKPRAYSWARSPRAMWGAIQLLRKFQTESRQRVVEGLVPLGDPVETEAKRVMLDTALDKTLTVTLGGNLRDTFTMGHKQMRRSLIDLQRIFQAQMGRPQGQRSPSFADMTMWPIEKLPAQFFDLQRQAIVIAPFTHVCFFARPPKYIMMDEDGYLHSETGPAALWEDGYEVWCQREPQDTLPEPGTYGAVKRLSAEESQTRGLNKFLPPPAEEKETP